MGDVEVHALRSVDLELYDGELVVILGGVGQRQVNTSSISSQDLQIGAAVLGA